MARAESGGEGRDGEGEADSLGFSQLAEARGEPAAPLPAEPGQGTDPAVGGEQEPAGSSSDGFNSSGLAHLALRLRTAWLTLLCVPQLGSLSPGYVGQDSAPLGEMSPMRCPPSWGTLNTAGQTADSHPICPMERCRTIIQLYLGGLWDILTFATQGLQVLP